MPSARPSVVSSGVVDTVADDLASRLIGFSTVVAVFCDSVTGSDVTGDGTFANPFQQPGRVFAALHVASTRGDRLQGFLHIHLIGVGPYRAPKVPPMPFFNLQWKIIGDRQGAPLWTGLLAAGTQPLLEDDPTAGTKASVWDHNIGAYDDTLVSDGSHWIEFALDLGDGSLLIYGKVLDGKESVSPNLRVVSLFDSGSGFAGTQATLRPCITQIVSDNVSAPTFALLDAVNEPSNNGVIGSLVGCRFVNMDSVESRRTAYEACTFDACFTRFTMNDNLQTENAYVNGGSFDVFGGINANFGGLWGETVVVSWMATMAEFGWSGMVRCHNESGDVARIGGITAVREPSCTCSLRLEGMDVECANAGDNGGIRSLGSHVRLGHQGPVTFRNVSSAIVADELSVVRLFSAHGSTQGVPFRFTDGALGFGFSACTIANLAAVGDEVTVGAAGNFAFAALPQNDLSAGALSELVRVT